MENETRRTRTSAATYARRLRKWRRWAAEMRDHGWTVVEPAHREGTE